MTGQNKDDIVTAIRKKNLQQLHKLGFFTATKAAITTERERKTLKEDSD